MQKIRIKHWKICALLLIASFLYLTMVCTEIMSAEIDDSYTEMGDSEEETAYKEFLTEKNYSKDMGSLDTMMYAVYDVNHDQKKELIVRGFHTENMYYKYGFYHYKDENVQLIGMLDNWQNGGNGEMYYVIKGNGIVVNTRLADRMSYTLYQIKDKVEENFTIHRQSVDVKKIGGNYERQYHYSCEDANGDPLGKKIDDEVWSEFEYRLQEIPFYEIGIFEEVLQYDASKEEGSQTTDSEHKKNEDSENASDKNIDKAQDTNSQEIDKISDAVQIVDKTKNLQYIGNKIYNLNLQRDENNHSALYPEMESGILAAFSMDFDGDGDEEIFSVSYDSSGQDGLGRVLHFLFLEKDEESWKITSDQEVITISSYGERVDRNCLDGRCVKEEDSVFFRKYNGTYEFFYEEYDAGIIADGQEWFFKGFCLENGELKSIDETDNLYFAGSPIDQFWENYEGSYSSELEKFSSLGFASPTVYFENMTVDSNDCLYKILRMVRDTSCSPDIINQWMGNYSQKILDGFTCAIEDKTEEIPENIEEFQTKTGYQSDGLSMDDQISLEADDNEKPNENVSENIGNEQGEDTAIQQSGNTPFYGIWCYGSKGEEESISYAGTLKSSGFDAKVFVTTDWSNLNTEKFYVVTAGIYATEDEANSALVSVQYVCPDAYVKYSGDFLR